MIIRSAQIATFESSDAPNFVSAAVAHVKESFPKHSRFLGETGVLETVQYGRRQSARYGLSKLSYAILFIDLMLSLGRRFDNDPQLPWAADALTDESSGTDDKVQTLHQRAMDYLDLVSGPANEYIDNAQSRLLREPSPIAGTSLPSSTDLMTRLEELFPEKALYLGKQGLDSLVQNAAAKSDQCGLATPPGVTLFAGMMFMLGSDFDSDPLFSWAASVLNDQRITSQDERIQRLYAAGMTYLKQWCAG